MPHPEIKNHTPFALQELHLSDEAGRPVLVVLLRATYSFGSGRLDLLEAQPPINVAGEAHPPEAPANGAIPEGELEVPPSWRWEPEIAFIKPGIDLVLLGHAVAPARGATTSEVRFRVGAIEQRARVFGDRVWRERLGNAVASSPLPFDRIPLRWERAFGGYDYSRGTAPWPCEMRNPVGRGYFGEKSSFREGVPLPNFEDPRAPIEDWRARPLPVGFGFTSPGWAPRHGLAGTYDSAWLQDRMPLLPADFDRRFFNAAAPGLVADKLQGDEVVELHGVSARGPLSFRLPGPLPLVGRVGLRTGDAAFSLRMDTLVVDADAQTVSLSWRGHQVLTRGAHDVAAIEVGAPRP